MDYLAKFSELLKSGLCYECAKELYELAHSELPERIYKYYSLNQNEDLNNTKLSCLKENKIYLSKADEFNDPFENKAFYYDKRKIREIALRYNYEWRLDNPYVFEKRFACFTESGVENMPMWAHYSNNHQGYCVSYKLDIENIELTEMTLPIQYTDKRVDITPLLEDKFNKSNDIHEIEETFYWCSIYLSCIKQTRWGYEKEYRCLYPPYEEKKPYVSVKAEKIFIGTQCNNKHKAQLVNIAHLIRVPIYQMEMDLDSPEYKLKGKQI